METPNSNHGHFRNWLAQSLKPANICPQPSRASPWPPKNHKINVNHCAHPEEPPKISSIRIQSKKKWNKRDRYNPFNRKYLPRVNEPRLGKVRQHSPRSHKRLPSQPPQDERRCYKNLWHDVQNQKLFHQNFAWRRRAGPLQRHQRSNGSKFEVLELVKDPEIQSEIRGSLWAN